MANNPNFTYNTAGQLTSITEYGDVSKGFVTGSATATYEYDNNGNLKKDNHKGISSVTYNYLNLPRKVTYAGGNWIEWTYDAAGIKLQKETSAGNNQYYIGGIEYSGTNLDAIYHEEGFLKPDGANFDYYYYLKDHLGNNRVVFHDSNGNGSITSSEITQENHYYPFGMDMQGAWTATPTDNYKYNNKELNEDFGLNWYDYGARWYDPAVARFTSVDVLADTLPMWSPYHYSLNNPIRFIDPDGKYPEDIVLGEGNKDVLLKNLQALTNDRLVFNPETGKVFIQSSNTANTGKNLSEGTKLVRELISDDNTTTIHLDPVRGNGTFAVNPKNNFELRGEPIVGEEYNANVYIKGTATNTVNEDFSRGAPSFISLGHELKHSLDLVTGSYDNTGLPRVYDFDRGEHGKFVNDFTSREFNTRIFENKLRTEHNVTKRILPIPDFSSIFLR